VTGGDEWNNIGRLEPRQIGITSKGYRIMKTDTETASSPFPTLLGYTVRDLAAVGRDQITPTKEISRVLNGADANRNKAPSSGTFSVISLSYALHYHYVGLRRAFTVYADKHECKTALRRYQFGRTRERAIGDRVLRIFSVACIAVRFA